jgi:hypothetical protein
MDDAKSRGQQRVRVRALADQLDEIADSGAAACRAGLRLADNPHDPQREVVKWAHWRVGYQREAGTGLRAIARRRHRSGRTRTRGTFIEKSQPKD